LTIIKNKSNIKLTKKANDKFVFIIMNNNLGGIEMKIAISASGKNNDSLLDKRFGRCEYFQIHDTDTKEIKVIENVGNTASGGAGIAASNQLIDEKVEVIITGNLGPNAFELIEKEGIKAYKCDVLAITLVLEKYSNGELQEITSSGPAYHGGNN
jgi:predicted Fe-Mo cluster-binding NifX family protein